MQYTEQKLMIYAFNLLAKNKPIFLVKIVIFSQLTMTEYTAEMFWMPCSTNSHHALLQVP